MYLYIYRNHGKIYFDFEYAQIKAMKNVYHSTEEKLWHTVKHFVRVRANPHYKSSDESHLISKIKELDKRFLERKGHKHAP